VLEADLLRHAAVADYSAKNNVTDLAFTFSQKLTLLHNLLVLFGSFGNQLLEDKLIFQDLTI
jgi:hypothetical protein